MDASRTPRWVLIALSVIVGLLIVALWPTKSSAPTMEPEAEPAATAADENRGPATRRVKPECVPLEEGERYESLVDKRALTTLSWDGMAERAENLQIPIHIVGIGERGVAVRFLQFPMREQYIHIWLGSEHIQPGPERTFFLDPCSAEIAAWPEMEREDAD